MNIEKLKRFKWCSTLFVWWGVDCILNRAFKLVKIASTSTNTNCTLENDLDNPLFLTITGTKANIWGVNYFLILFLLILKDLMDICCGLSPKQALKPVVKFGFKQEINPVSTIKRKVMTGINKHVCLL